VLTDTTRAGGGAEQRRRLQAGPFRLTDWAQPSGARLGWHHHEAPSLSLALEGGYCESYRGRSVECRPGDVVVKPAGEGHRDRVGVTGARTLLVELPGSLTGELEEALRRLDEPGAHAEAGSTSLVWRCRDELERADAWVPLALESLAMELVVQVARAPERGAAAAPPQWLRRSGCAAAWSFSARRWWSR
jgi:hypothetical protein